MLLAWILSMQDESGELGSMLDISYEESYVDVPGVNFWTDPKALVEGYKEIADFLQKEVIERMFTKLLNVIKGHEVFETHFKSSDIDVRKFLNCNAFLDPQKSDFGFDASICGGTLQTFAYMRFMEIPLISRRGVNEIFYKHISGFGQRYKDFNNFHLIVSAADLLAKVEIEWAVKNHLNEPSYLQEKTQKIQRMLSAIYMYDIIKGLNELECNYDTMYKKPFEEYSFFKHYGDIWNQGSNLEISEEPLIKFCGVYCKYMLNILKSSRLTEMCTSRMNRMICGDLKDFRNVMEVSSVKIVTGLLPSDSEWNNPDQIRSPRPLVDLFEKSEIYEVPLSFTSYIEFFIERYGSDEMYLILRPGH
jgi:hypothetical protein